LALKFEILRPLYKKEERKRERERSQEKKRERESKLSFLSDPLYYTIDLKNLSKSQSGSNQPFYPTMGLS
jgi:hypothetical protein